jgi:hypothetical protein
VELAPLRAVAVLRRFRLENAALLSIGCELGRSGRSASGGATGGGVPDGAELAAAREAAARHQAEADSLRRQLVGRPEAGPSRGAPALEPSVEVAGLKMRLQVEAAEKSRLQRTAAALQAELASLRGAAAQDRVGHESLTQARLQVTPPRP